MIRPSNRASIRNISDYSPFGVQLAERTISGDGYRYGFQGQEKDDEVKGEGNSVNYKYRMHDPRIGRWLSVDPLAGKYAAWSPYAFCYNSPINVIDVDGREGIVLSGSPGDHKNKEHFLANGLDRAKAAQKRTKGSEKVTWLIYDSQDDYGHDPEYLKNYKAKAAKLGINVIVVTDEEEIIDYVNLKDVKGDKDTRSKDLITSFYYVGHADPGDMLVGYKQDGIDDYVAASDFESSAFASGCWVNVVAGCQTGVSNWCEDSVVEEFAEILDSKSTISGSSVRVQFDGGPRTDSQLLEENKGEIIDMKGELPVKK
jgi:RHS repeat-associated protein